jgi:hypothetical protein
MAYNPVTYRGEDAAIQIKGNSTGRKHGVLGLSDFTLTLDRGTVEQELVGEAGNYFVAGSLSCEGSLTACKLDATAAGDILTHVISGTRTWVSGSCGLYSLKFFFASCMITGFDLTVGDADTITEGSIDFAVENPKDIKAITNPDAPGISGVQLIA